MPIEEFAAQPFVHKHELLKYIIDVGLAKIDKDYAGFSPVQISSFFSDRKSYIYLNSKEMNQSSRPGNVSKSIWIVWIITFCLFICYRYSTFTFSSLWVHQVK